jgi:MFS family permease
MKPVRALEALNFFMADVQAGIGPFIGVVLLARGWHADEIGSVMTLAGLAAMAATPFAGALVDSTHSKRALMAASTSRKAPRRPLKEWAPRLVLCSAACSRNTSAIPARSSRSARFRLARWCFGSASR